MAPPYAMRFGVLLLLVFQVSSSVFGFMDLNKQCGSEDEYKECQFKNHNRTNGITCRYRKFNDFKTARVPLLESPGPAKELNVSLVKDTNHIVIAWNLPHDSSVLKLEGFLINVTFILDGRYIEILRTFKIHLGNLQDDQAISQAAIAYPCIGVFPQTLYRVQVISYPRSNIPAPKETEIYIPDFNFNVTAEATFSGDWRPRMWSTIHEEGTMYSLTVCFYGAPKEFRMLFYFLLLRFKDQERDIDKLTISVEDVAEVEGKEICRTFGNLINGDRSYYVHILPRGPDDCVCQFRDEVHKHPLCYDACPITEIGPIVLPAIDSPPPDPPGLPINSILISLCVLVIAIMAAVSAYLIYKYAISRIKKYISKVQKGKVLIVIVNNMTNHVSMALKEHLEKNLFNYSYWDLTNETETTGSSVSLLNDKIQENHKRYLVVHQAGAKCEGLGEPELSKDQSLAKSVQKFFKGKAKNSGICMHSFQLKSGSDPKAILKIVCSLVGEAGVFHPPEELSDEQASEALKELTCISTFIIEPERFDSIASYQWFDSGYGEV